MKARMEREEYDKFKKEAFALLSGFVSPVFDLKNPKPLKMGIFKEVKAILDEKQLNLPAEMIKKAIKSYVLETKYLKRFLREDMRYDLDGQPCEPILEEHKEFARRMLENRGQFKKKKKRKSKKTQNKSNIDQKEMINKNT